MDTYGLGRRRRRLKAVANDPTANLLRRRDRALRPRSGRAILRLRRFSWPVVVRQTAVKRLVGDGSGIATR